MVEFAFPAAGFGQQVWWCGRSPGLLGAVVEAGCDFLRVGALSWVLGEAVLEQGAEWLRYVFESRFVVHDPVQEGGEVEFLAVGEEGAVAGCRVHENRGEGEHVGRGSGDRAGGLFGCEEAGCADDGAGAGVSWVVDGAGDSEVDEEGTFRAEEYVRGLDVTVDDVGVAHAHQGRGQFLSQASDGGCFQRAPAVYPVGQGGGGYVLGRQPLRGRPGWAEVHHRHRPRGAHPVAGAYLAVEAFGEVRVAAEFSDSSPCSKLYRPCGANAAGHGADRTSFSLTAGTTTTSTVAWCGSSA